MAEQAKITDFFTTTKRNGSTAEPRKRKALSPTRDIFAPSTSKRPKVTAAPASILQSRGKMCLSLSKSPVKQSLATDSTKAASPIKKNLNATLNEILKSPQKEPAFRRFRHLVDKSAETALVLPAKYKTLVETFRCMENVVSLMHNRNEMCSFEKVRMGVQKMTCKAFTLFILAQLKTIYPESYVFKYERITQMSKAQTTKVDLALALFPQLSTRNMSPSVILMRKNFFTRKLLDLTKKHHKDYLQALHPPIVIDDNSLTKWHPNFPLDKVPDIDPIPGALPEAPVKSDADSVEDYLEKARIRLGIKSPVKDVPLPILKSPVKITKGALKGISTGLLERIRAKEAQNLANEMTRSPETEKKLNMIKRLPEFIRIINNYFVGERRATLPFESVVEKCRDSYYTNISLPEVHDHVQLIHQLLPDWLYRLEVRKGTFIKIDKDKSLEDLNKRLEAASQRLRDGRSP